MTWDSVRCLDTFGDIRGFGSRLFAHIQSRLGPFFRYRSFFLTIIHRTWVTRVRVVLNTCGKLSSRNCFSGRHLIHEPVPTPVTLPEYIPVRHTRAYPRLPARRELSLLIERYVRRNQLAESVETRKHRWACDTHYSLSAYPSETSTR